MHRLPESIQQLANQSYESTKFSYLLALSLIFPVRRPDLIKKANMCKESHSDHLYGSMVMNIPLVVRSDMVDGFMVIIANAI